MNEKFLQLDEFFKIDVRVNLEGQIIKNKDNQNISCVDDNKRIKNFFINFLYKRKDLKYRSNKT